MSGIGRTCGAHLSRLAGFGGAAPLRSLAALAARTVLGSLFVWAGALKLASPRAFAHVIDGYGLVPDGWPLVIAALAIPGSELLAGVGALLDRRWGYRLMLGLLALFIGALGFGIANNLDVDCGCFSLEERRGQAGLRAAFARDWVLVAGVAWCLRFRGRYRAAAQNEGTTKGRDRE